MRRRLSIWPDLDEAACPTEEQMGFLPPRLRYVPCPLSTTYWAGYDKTTSHDNRFVPVVASSENRLKIFIDDMEPDRDYPCDFQGASLVVRRETSGKIRIYEAESSDN